MRFALLPLLLGCSDYGVEKLSDAEVFEQPSDTVSADILFVVDDSSSMSEEQARLGENFSAFVTVLEETYADFQIGVVTTDVTGEHRGALHGGILTPATADSAAAFRAAVTVGSDGSRDEQGLTAAVLALDPATNPGFVRPTSKLNIVFVSDEDDHSPEATGTYVTALAARAGTGGFSAHALVGDLPVGCVSGSSAADAGIRYLAAAESTGGWADSICTDDYTPLLTRVGLDAAGWNTTFVLENVPNPASLEVTVDGVIIPERPVDGWQFSLGDNAIVFYGRAVPRPGMTVEVTYTPWIGPTDDSGQ